MAGTADGFKLLKTRNTLCRRKWNGCCFVLLFCFFCFQCLIDSMVGMFEGFLRFLGPNFFQ